MSGLQAADLFADPANPMAQMMRAMADMAPADVPFEMVKPVYQAMAATARLGWDPYLHDPKLRKRLHRITCPTLVVRGGADALVPAAHAEAYAAEIPGAQLVVIEGAGHLLPLEKPAELAAAVRAFCTT